MPFEPRIAQQPDEEGEFCPRLGDPPAPQWNDAAELELPEDLAALAEQLCDDAVFLAQRHPANATPQEREAALAAEIPAAGPIALGWYRRAAVAAAVLLAVGGGVLVWQIADEQGNSPAVAEGERHARSAPAVAMTNTDNTVAPLATTRSSPKQGQSRAGDELPVDGPRLIPAAFLPHVSGPELDGMLDLLEEDEEGLSI